MNFECSAIILVILILSILTVRSGNKSGWGIAALPLVLIPAGHIAGGLLVPLLSGLLPSNEMTTWIGYELFILVITCLLLGLISSKIKSKRARAAYLIVCGGFSAILTCVLLVRTVI